VELTAHSVRFLAIPRVCSCGPLLTGSVSSFSTQGEVVLDKEALVAGAQVFAAVGTVSVAVLAIWGDWFRSKLAAPRLELKLRDRRGNLTSRGNGTATVFYHLVVNNHRHWAPATHVRVLLTRYEKRLPDGTYFPEPLVAPLQLTWAFPQFHELLPTIAKTDTCDLGFLDQGAAQFRLSLYISPNNFSGFLRSGEAMRVHLVARADNAETAPLVVEIAWNGQWSQDMDQLQRHLVVREVSDDKVQS